MKEFLIYSLVIASISFTVSEASIFSKLRTKVKFRSKFFGKLICCGYCLGHWLSACAVIIFKINLEPLGYFLTIFALAWVAGFQWALMGVLWKIAGK
jgi:hypothetical protein